MVRAYEKDRLDISVNRKVSLLLHTNVKQEKVFHAPVCKGRVEYGN